MPTGAHKTQRISSALTLTAIPQRWPWISRSHRTSNRWLNLGIIGECLNQRVMKSSGCSHIYHKKPKKFKQSLSAYQKADSNCFLEQERSADGRIHATRYHNNVRSVLKGGRECVRPFRTKGVECWHDEVLLQEYERPHRSTRCSHSSTAGAFQLGVIWPPSLQPWSRSKLLQPFTYLKNWLCSQRFNNNEKLKEGVKTWLSSQAYKILFLHTTSASVPEVTGLRISLSMYAFCI
jgi:hypothetical protein